RLEPSRVVCMRRHAFNSGLQEIICAVGLVCTVVLCGQAAETITNPAAQSEKALPPVLDTAEKIHWLTRKEAAAEHRAVIRGVVTCYLPGWEAAVIQDSTRGIYV